MEILGHIRGFFAGEGYLEADTPLLSPFLIPESHIEVFRTRYLHPSGRATEMYLVPSPELWMKRLLAMGAGNLFQITRSFRNCESLGEHHNPEFTMLEWYTVEADYLDSISITERLFDCLLRRLPSPSPFRYQGQPIELHPPFARITMEEAFRRYAGLELAGCLSLPRLRAEARRRDIPCPEDDPWDDLFHRIFLTLVEPCLPRHRPVVLLDYPGTLPTLARKRPGTPFAERWELYVGGLEVANCYTEETDPRRLAEFIRAERRRKAAGCRVRHRPDTGLPRALRRSMPRCTGVALGVDRLLMLLLDQKSIEGVVFFPFSAIMAANRPKARMAATTEKGRI
jgi:lysyl-tRNA synthetase class 2